MPFFILLKSRKRLIILFYTSLGGENITAPIIKPIESLNLIRNINNNDVYLKDGRIINIIKVEPINLKLKSVSEQNAIIEGYKHFLKLCNFDFQIVIQTQKIDVSKIVDSLKEYASNDESISDMIIDYSNLIKEISSVRGGISRKFYIIVTLKENQKNSIGKIIDGLKMCGNEARVCDEKEIINVFKNCFK